MPAFPGWLLLVCQNPWNSRSDKTLPSEGTRKPDAGGLRHTREVVPTMIFALCPMPSLLMQSQLSITEAQAVQTLDVAQAGEWQGEDHC